MVLSELSKRAETGTLICQETGSGCAVYSGAERSGQAVWAQQGSWVMGRNPSWDEVILKPKDTSLVCSVGFKGGSRSVFCCGTSLSALRLRPRGWQVRGVESKRGKHVLPNHPSPYLVLSQLHTCINSFPFK